MQFSLFISSVWSAGFTNAGFLAAIAVLACVLGAEIAGICILISKMMRARAARTRQRHMEKREEQSSIYRDYAVTAVLLFGAIPKASYLVLTVLSVLAVLAAILFVVLLVIFRSCGYDFASASRMHEAASSENAPVEPRPEEEPVTVVAEEYLPDDSEEQRQEAYVTPEEPAEDEEEPFAMFAEETEQGYDVPETDADFDADEPADDEVVAEEVSEVEPIAEVLEPMVAPVTETTTVTTVSEEPVLADGSQPYKVVEKIVTETVKEVYTETPAPAQQPAAASNNDAVLEKLVDLLEYEIRGRREQEQAEKEANETKNDSVATFAKAELPDEEEDDEDDDELDTEDGETVSDDEDDDRDDEENDTEGDHFTGNERIIGFDEETGCYIVARYRKSFEAKLIQARPNIKQYYSDLKNALLSYKGTKSRISWTADSFHNGRTQIAKINAKTRILEIYFAIDPATLEGTVYRGRDVGSKKKYAETPFQYKIRTPRKFKWAMELVQRVSEEHGLTPIDIEHVNYEEQYPFDSTENLVARKLIKEYIRQEKPATSFELAPDHVPSVPDEDESVIPANANFSWEFDNERMPEPEVAPEPVPEPEPIAEPEPAPEVTPEPAAESEPAVAQPVQATVTRETVKVTEVRYTERYYKDAQPTYEQVITTTEPIEAIAAPADEPDVAETVSEETADAAEDTWNLPDVFGAMSDDENDAEFGAEEPYVTEADEKPATEEDEEPQDEELQDEVSEDALVWESEESYEETLEQPEEDPAEEAVEEESYEEESYEAESYAEESEVEFTEEEEEIEEPAQPAVNLNTSVAVVDICAVEAAFPTGALVNLETLKAHDLVIASATVLKIYASGSLSKAFTVEANQFTLDAIKAISAADGDSVMVR